MKMSVLPLWVQISSFLCVCFVVISENLWLKIILRRKNFIEYFWVVFFAIQNRCKKDCFEEKTCSLERCGHWTLIRINFCSPIFQNFECLAAPRPQTLKKWPKNSKIYSFSWIFSKVSVQIEHIIAFSTRLVNVFKEVIDL
jgi:hypothetical protein